MELLQKNLSQNEAKLILQYHAPADKGTLILSPGAGRTTEENIWQQYTLPIGNGDMGANIYGGISEERLTFNEKTLWTGGPGPDRPDYMGGNLKERGLNGKTLRKIQKLFREGRNTEASEACEELIGGTDGYGAYQCWGNLRVRYEGLEETSAGNYLRRLDLENAVADVAFDCDRSCGAHGGTQAFGTQDNPASTHYEREYFMSHPAKILAAKLTARGKDKLNLVISFDSAQQGITIAEQDSLRLEGEVIDNGLKYCSLIKAETDRGNIKASGDRLLISEAESVVIYLAAATDYENRWPAYRTGETAAALKDRVAQALERAAARGYEMLKEEHIRDYRKIFSRVSLDLGQKNMRERVHTENIHTEAANTENADTKNCQERSPDTTDRLLERYKNGLASRAESRWLEVLLFQYGRYLLISSSREDSQLPANLQGVWNISNDPIWSCDYHLNVNLQMNYWPAGPANMAECILPLIRYVDSLRVPGRITAKIYAGIDSTPAEPDNGFMAHTQNTPFGWTCPGWSFDWGWSPAAVPWILQNCWEYYEFTGNKEILENMIYPMMREEAKLYDQLLVRKPDGTLVSSPAYSPEHGPRTEGNTYEHTLIWQLYEDTIRAAGQLGLDRRQAEVWKENQKRLKGPAEIGGDGQLKEWYEESRAGSVKESEGYAHRHLSHMLGLYPGSLISMENTELLQAAITALDQRTDVSTGWGMGQRINSRARTGDGEKAYQLIQMLIRTGIYPNLFDAHPPFQIDGNFGLTAGICEMLIQSKTGVTRLLPALPQEWPDGSFEGLAARRNDIWSAEWRRCRLLRACVYSANGGTVTVHYAGIQNARLLDETGTSVNMHILSSNRIAFYTEAGKRYYLYMHS